jgi:uncharacterized protein with PQ loop repeat
MVMAILGYLGALLLGACALPLLVRTLRDGHARGVSALFLVSWFLGECLMLAYVVLLPALSIPLFANYLANVLMVGLVCFYRVRPRVKSLQELAAELEQGG